MRVSDDSSGVGDAAGEMERRTFAVPSRSGHAARGKDRS
jgi:hypothetical protein